MKGSFKLARIAEINVMVHWTFAILLIWVAVANLMGGFGIAAAIYGVVFVLAIFVCVVLHEFGHALTAKRFGINTPDITLLPIGGVARLERIPENPWQEFVIAIAGPMVNVVIVAILALIYLLGGFMFQLSTTEPVGTNFLASLMIVNVALVVFNMIPAFPMDGGRVLRAVLAMNMDYVNATRVAANIGQLIAIGLGIVGLFTNWFLMFIALFVYLGAAAEASMVRTRSMLEGVKVRAAMMTRFVTIAPDDSIRSVVNELLAGDQEDFPVVEANTVVGILSKPELLQAVSDQKTEVSIGDVMTTEFRSLRSDDQLKDIFEEMLNSTCRALPVVDEGNLVGLLNQNNIAEWLTLREASMKSSEANSNVTAKLNKSTNVEQTQNV